MANTITNILSDYNLLGASKGGTAGLRPLLKEMMLGDLGPMSVLMQFSSAFHFISGAGVNDAETRSLWNGSNSIISAGAGDVTFDFSPGFTDPVINSTTYSAAAGDTIIPIIVLDTGGTAVNFVINAWTRANGITTACRIETNSTGGTGAALSGWALFIGARKPTWDFDASAVNAGLSDNNQKVALHGGVQT